MNNDLKVAGGEQQSALLQSEEEELRFLQEKTKYGHSLSESKRALRNHKINGILHTQVGSISFF